MLNNDEIKEAQEFINKKHAGVYELSEIFGKHWDTISGPKSYGIQFKITVEKNMLKGISLGEKTNTNHRLYIID